MPVFVSVTLQHFLLTCYVIVTGEPYTEFLDYMASVKLADEDQLYEMSLKIVPKSAGTIGGGAGFRAAFAISEYVIKT
jgi:hypothetical protein